MKKTVVSLALMGLLALGGQAFGVICAIDAVPAATLLLPYFELDLNNPNGLTTLFSVKNASEEAALVHVTIWSDLSVPVLDFDIYLTGYDVQTVNLRDIIFYGNLPRTADEANDPTETISPQGPFSDEASFNGCSLPYSPLPAVLVSEIQKGLTGQPLPPPFNVCSGGPPCCAGQSLGDNIARGYITMDSVNNCSQLFPGDPGYFAAGGTGTANDKNILWGDWFIVNAAQNFAEGGDLVHIEADAVNPETTTSGNYTYYGGLLPTPFTAIDNREPLADTFATNFLNGGTFNSGTSLLVWRDAKQRTPRFLCPAVTGTPIWYPLSQQAIVIFDEQEQPTVPPTFPISPPIPGQTLIPFPAQTQRVVVGGATLPVTPNFGWLYLGLKTAVQAGAVLGYPPNDTANDIINGNHISTQAYVIATYASNGRFAVGVDAIKLDSACSNPGGPGTPGGSFIAPTLIPGTNGPFDYIPGTPCQGSASDPEPCAPDPGIADNAG